MQANLRAAWRTIEDDLKADTKSTALFLDTPCDFEIVSPNEIQPPKKKKLKADDTTATEYHYKWTSFSSEALTSSDHIIIVPRSENGIRYDHNRRSIAGTHEVLNRFAQAVYRELRQALPESLLDANPQSMAYDQGRVAALGTRKGAKRQGFHMDSLRKNDKSLIMSIDKPCRLIIFEGSLELMDDIDALWKEFCRPTTAIPLAFTRRPDVWWEYCCVKMLEQRG